MTVSVEIHILTECVYINSSWKILNELVFFYIYQQKKLFKNINKYRLRTCFHYLIMNYILGIMVLAFQHLGLKLKLMTMIQNCLSAW